MEKTKAYLGFAKKSGKIAFGIDNAVAKRSKLIIFSNELSENSKNKIKNSKIQFIELEKSEYQKLAESALAIGILDSSLADAIKNSIAF